MKKVKKYTILLALAFVCACNMEELPKATTSKEPVFQTEKRIENVHELFL